MGRWSGWIPQRHGSRVSSRAGGTMSSSGALDPRPATRDQLGRPLGSLRISVTDRCNLRCAYCMPEEHYVWLPKQSLLTFEEISRLARIFVRLGASKLRLTGGEPLLRHDLPTLVAMLAGQARPADLAMTTNGMLLEPE